MNKYLDDILFFSGGSLIVAGFYLVLALPGALFSAGVLLIVAGIMAGSAKGKQ